MGFIQSDWTYPLTALVMTFLFAAYVYSILYRPRRRGKLSTKELTKRRLWSEKIVQKEWLVRQAAQNFFNEYRLVLQSHDAQRQTIELRFKNWHPDLKMVKDLKERDIVVFKHRIFHDMQYAPKDDFCAFIQIAHSRKYI